MITNLKLVKNKYYFYVGKYCVSNAGVLKLSGLRPLFLQAKLAPPLLHISQILVPVFHARESCSSLMTQT